MDKDGHFTEFVTFTIAGQLFGLPIAQVQDVFKPTSVTRVPLAGAEIAGVLNLRGRIVTAIEMRSRLDAQPRDNGTEAMAIGIEAKGKSFGLLVDAVGEVLKLADFELEPIGSISTATSPSYPTGSIASTISCLLFWISTKC